MLALYWDRLTTAGGVAGGAVGLIAAVAALVLGPGIWVAVLKNPDALFPFPYPAIVALPLTPAVAGVVSMFTAIS